MLSLIESVHEIILSEDTIASKINVTPKDVYLPIVTKVKFVTAVKFHYRMLQLAAVFLTPLGVTFILLVMVQPYTSVNIKTSLHAFYATNYC